jgi:type IV pilus assembly protein PilE
LASRALRCWDGDAGGALRCNAEKAGPGEVRGDGRLRMGHRQGGFDSEVASLGHVILPGGGDCFFTDERRMMQRPAGFTLIELLVVMAIIGILSSIAYPSYTAHLLRLRRLEGVIALTEAMQRQEALYVRANRYVLFGAEMASGGGAGAGAGAGSGSGGGSDGSLDANGFKWWSGASPAVSAYEVHAEACDGAADATQGGGAGEADLRQCVALVAIPGSARVDSRFRDSACGTLTLLSTGEQRAAGPGKGCWP